ncbi:MAG TPA: ribonuclease H-like domain-containing protein [Myxococcaceae bacterium]|nr:ribonuclease H-like domain-containing protein [Myxococcaceae bacterium]
MIERTFQHVPGIGPWRERNLWEQGIRTWASFPEAPQKPVVSRAKDPVIREWIAKAGEALEAADLAGLASLFPGREHWRLIRRFGEGAVFFDIETDGSERQLPTVVSLLDAEGLHLFVRGENLEALPDALMRRPIWVTFNGSCFDVPVLREHFPQLTRPPVHLDLRFLGRRIGLKGGLKQIERGLGLDRSTAIDGVGGMDAVLLWRAWLETRDPSVLQLLVEYNLYDAINLRSLLHRVLDGLLEQSGFGPEEEARFSEPETEDGSLQVRAVLEARNGASVEAEGAAVLARTRARYGVF